MNKAFEIVFNDEYLIVVNKIAKLLIQPTPKKEKNTLTSILSRSIKEKVFPCHRLDRETSGLIIYAKSKNIQNKIMEQFKKGEVKKKYLAFVRGKLVKKKGILKDYIIDKQGARFKEKPKEAKTIYRTVKEFKTFSILELIPLTGRTNQLRIQLSKRGSPILGERVYAFRRDFKVDFKRLALHAFSLSFIHPISNQRVNLNIELAQDMSKFMIDR